MAQQEASGKAVASLVFSILGIVACPIVCSIVGIILGAGEEDGVGKAGYILGWVGLLLVALPLMIAIVFFGAFGVIGATAAG